MKSAMFRHTLGYILASLLVGGICWGMGATSARAQVGIPNTIELDGYAWSSNIGWISMNCKTGSVTGTSVCGTSDYQVSLSTSGDLTGYAWSSNIGWIRFGGLSGFPSSAGTTAADATVTGTYPNLTFRGWARACAGTTSVPGSCSSMTSRTDGWDGWISLGQTTGQTHSVFTNSTGPASGSYAWGSDVVGWIDMFSQMTWDGPSATLSVGTCQVPLSSDACTATSTWVILPTTAVSPSLYRSSPSPTTLYPATRTGTNQSVTLKTGANTFQARTGSTVLVSVTRTPTCAGTAAVNMATGFCENPPPTITIVANDTVIRNGATEPITWTITGLLDGNCTLRGPGIAASGVTVSGSGTSAPLTSFTRFGISCTGSYGTVDASDAVEVVPAVQEV